MIFTKLPKDKRKPLVLIVLSTILVLGGLIMGLIRPQYETLTALAQARLAAEAKLAQMKQATKHADEVEAELDAAKARLAAAETGVASGDLYSWLVDTLRRFKAPYQVDIPTLSPVGAASDVSLLPKFPYRQATISVSGAAYYHDLGRFLADLENAFPYIRVLNLTLDPASAPDPAQAEKLYFKLDLVALVKTNPS
jgi:hypothetical protein